MPRGPALRSAPPGRSILAGRRAAVASARRGNILLIAAAVSVLITVTTTLSLSRAQLDLTSTLVHRARARYAALGGLNVALFETRRALQHGQDPPGSMQTTIGSLRVGMDVDVAPGGACRIVATSASGGRQVIIEAVFDVSVVDSDPPLME